MAHDTLETIYFKYYYYMYNVCHCGLIIASLVLRGGRILSGLVDRLELIIMYSRQREGLS